MLTELSDQSYVGTALTLQLAAGFALTVATIWLLPILEDTDHLDRKQSNDTQRGERDVRVG